MLGVPRTVMHRGAGGVAPENTLAAIAAGGSVRPDFVEVDVQLTADGVPVLLHDTTLRRTTNVEVVFPERADAPLRSFTYDEVRRLDAGSWFGDAFAGEPVPAFGEILDAIPPGVGVFVELKYPGESPDLVSASAAAFAADSRWAHRAAARQVMALSFDHVALHELHARHPDIAAMPLGVVPEDASVLAATATWATAWGTNHRTVTAADVARIHAAGMACSVYTVNSPTAVADLVGAGVDIITTDFPGIVPMVERAQGDVRWAS